MPHEPGHTNGATNNNSYVIAGTKEPYSGRVVFIGDTPFSTTGGAFEGVPYSQELIQVAPDPQQVIEQNQVNTSNDVVTQFVVTSNQSNEFFVEGFSNSVGGFYYDLNGNDRVPTGTKLHHHTNPAVGDNNFMTQHSMDGGAVNVYTFNQTREFLQDNMTTLPSAGTSGGTTGGRNTTPRSSGRNMGGGTRGGGSSGGY
mgnify:CR=1 FL=1